MKCSHLVSCTLVCATDIAFMRSPMPQRISSLEVLGAMLQPFTPQACAVQAVSCPATRSEADTYLAQGIVDVEHGHVMARPRQGDRRTETGSSGSDDNERDLQTSVCCFWRLCLRN